VFAEEFREHVGTSCSRARELAFHKIVTWDMEARRFVYDRAYVRKQPDWTFSA
jgi:hypothetical protein